MSTTNGNGMLTKQVREDSVLESGEPLRLHYATGILLAADDLRAEQDYHRGRLARALKYLHGAGTVAGLRVRHHPAVEAVDDKPASPEMLTVDAGLAIDAAGRLLEIRAAQCWRLDSWYERESKTKPHHFVRRPVTILADRFDDDAPLLPESIDLNGIVLDIFAQFLVCESGRTPAFATGPYAALDAVQPARLRDAVQLVIAPRTEDTPPLPADPFAGFADGLPADPTASAREQRHRLRQAILGGWHEPGDPASRLYPAHVPSGFGIEPDALLLARVVLPASDPPDSNTAAPRDMAQPVRVDNSCRPFALSAAALAAWSGLTPRTL